MATKKKVKKKKAVKRKASRSSRATLYVYTLPRLAQFARVKGSKWGSFSNYVSYLLARDKQDKTAMKATMQVAKATAILAAKKFAKKKAPVSASRRAKPKAAPQSTQVA